jgi:hypothetical protein
LALRAVKHYQTSLNICQPQLAAWSIFDSRRRRFCGSAVPSQPLAKIERLRGLCVQKVNKLSGNNQDQKSSKTAH